ncbi:hypothetical protein Tco_0606104 [Tanacetum coccineum]
MQDNLCMKTQSSDPLSFSAAYHLPPSNYNLIYTTPRNSQTSTSVSPYRLHEVLAIQKGRVNKPKPQANKKDKGKGKADNNKQVVAYQPKPKQNPPQNKGDCKSEVELQLRKKIKKLFRSRRGGICKDQEFKDYLDAQGQMWHLLKTWSVDINRIQRKLYWVAVKHILNDKDERMSQMGMVFVVNRRQKSGQWSWFGLENLLEITGVMPSIKEPINVYCDNSTFANDSGIMEGARHFLQRYHYVREQVKSGEIKVLKVHTDDNLADPFTKALPKGKVTDHAN